MKYPISFSLNWAGSEWSLANITYYNDANEVVTDTLQATQYEIKEGITKFEDRCFLNSRYLLSITIPNEVTSLGISCFEECGSLKNITIPSSVTEIGEDCFLSVYLQNIYTPESNIENLKTIMGVSNPDQVSLIKDELFPYIKYPISFNGTWEGLGWASEYITYYDSAGEIVTDTALATQYSVINTPVTIENFYLCTQLVSITIPLSVYSIGDSCFQGCTSLVSIDMHEGVSFFGYSTFQDCTALTSITIPKNVSEIYSNCFQGCTNINTVYIPESLTQLNAEVFKDCVNLEIITIPNTMQIISSGCFQNCTSLTSIYTPESNVENLRTIMAVNNIEQVPLIKNSPITHKVKILVDNEGQYVPVSHADSTYVNELDETGKSKTITTKLTELTNVNDSKVDKIEGKGLSTNDFTTAEKTKLESLENYDDSEILSSLSTKAEKLYVDSTIATETEARDAADTELSAEISEVRNIAIGSKSSWTGELVPDLTNEPAVNWTTDADKDSHIGEIYINVDPDSENSGKMWRWVKLSDTYSWMIVKDTDATTALSTALLAQETANTKNTVWLEQPTKYSKGDSWMLSESTTLNDIYYVKGTKLISTSNSDSFISSHWIDSNNDIIGTVNLLEKSNDISLFVGYNGSTLEKSKVSEFGFEDANRVVSSGGTGEYNNLQAVLFLSTPKDKQIVSYSFFIKNNGTNEILIHSNQGEIVHTLLPEESKFIEWKGIIGNGVGIAQIQVRTRTPLETVDFTWARIMYVEGNKIGSWQPKQGIANMEVEYEDGTFETINIVTAI